MARRRSTDIPALRMRNQRLAGRPLEDPARVVSWLGAVQAQEYQWAKWALALRATSTTSAAIDRLLADGDIVRTHVMRPTWHFVPRADVRWLLDLTAPRVEALAAGYYRRLELDPATRRRSNAAIAKALAGGKQLTRPELKAVLAARKIPTDTMRFGFLLGHAELSQVISSGGRRGKQFTYALFDERVPPSAAIERDEALSRLVIRYFTSHGPATPRDFAWWSGLTVADARRGIEAADHALERLVVDETEYWLGAEQVPPGRAARAHLLPVYDEYLIGYRDRSAAFEPDLPEAQREYARSSDVLWANFVVVRGMVVGGWKRLSGAGTATAQVRLLRHLTSTERAALDAAARRYAKFSGMRVRMRYRAP